jgi:hypothetical protein
MQALVEDISKEELEFASHLVKGHRMVEVPGKEVQASIALKPMRPPRRMMDYISAPCTHECVIIKQRRHTKQSHKVLSSLDLVRSALMRASTRQLD